MNIITLPHEETRKALNAVQIVVKKNLNRTSLSYVHISATEKDVTFYASNGFCLFRATIEHEEPKFAGFKAAIKPLKLDKMKYPEEITITCDGELVEIDFTNKETDRICKKYNVDQRAWIDWTQTEKSLLNQEQPVKNVNTGHLKTAIVAFAESTNQNISLSHNPKAGGVIRLSQSTPMMEVSVLVLPLRDVSRG